MCSITEDKTLNLSDQLRISGGGGAIAVYFVNNLLRVSVFVTEAIQCNNTLEAK